MNITGKTSLLGVMGWPVAHSFSPVMHNTAAQDLGLDVVYVPLAVRPGRLADAVRGLPALGFRGVNVTVPHKEAILPLLDEIDPAAQAIGAVNTVDIPGGERSVGYNTDWSGFLADLEAQQVVVTGRDCLVIGAGGSARAVVYALLQTGARVHCFARRPEQARQLQADILPSFPGRMLRTYPWPQISAVAAHLTAPLIVNCTPLGMVPHNDTSPWPDDTPFPAGSYIYDLVYNPRETRLMQQAKAAGCKASNGLGTLVFQGALAFEIWMGVRPEVQIMLRTIRENNSVTL